MLDLLDHASDGETVQGLTTARSLWSSGLDRSADARALMETFGLEFVRERATAAAVTEERETALRASVCAQVDKSMQCLGRRLTISRKYTILLERNSSASTQS